MLHHVASPRSLCPHAAVVACCATLLFGGCGGPSAPALNVLVVTLDTTRADHLGCYGYAKPTSPNIDRLAGEGVLFRHAIAPASVTNTSHASLFTGLEPYNHDVRFLLDRRLSVLDDDFTTLAEVFAAAGAETAAFVSAIPASSDFGFDQGFVTFDDDFERDGRINQRRGDDTADAALHWLERTSEPFLGWVHFFDPHDPKLIPPADVCEPFKPANPQHLPTATRAVYDAEISYMDAQIQRLVDALDARGLRERTIIAIVADHGEGLGEHDWWHHGIIYQEQVHVPLILLKPGGPAGLEVDALVRMVDVMPTLLGWAEIADSRWPRMDGVDLTPLFDDPGARLIEYAYSDSTNMQSYGNLGEKKRKTDKLYSVTDGRWKLIHHQLRPAESELYDLRNDPDELVNRLDAEPEVHARLKAELMRRDPLIDEISGMESLDPEMLEKLKSLGYAE